MGIIRVAICNAHDASRPAGLVLTPHQFWATKVNAAGRGGGKAEPAAVRAQIERSLAIIRKPVIDVLQVHNLVDLPGQLPTAQEFKKAGRVKCVGITTTSDSQYGLLNCSCAMNRSISSASITPLTTAAWKKGFCRSQLKRRLRCSPTRRLDVPACSGRAANKSVPEWAREFDATTWAQFFLK